MARRYDYLPLVKPILHVTVFSIIAGCLLFEGGCTYKESEGDLEWEIVEAEYETFWPPPQASGFERLPRELLAFPDTTTYMRDVDALLTSALDSCGYTSSAYYLVPAGFALVTRMEQTDRDGTPKRGDERWSLSPPEVKGYSIKSCIERLFGAAPGYYRVIAFIVTSEEIQQDSVTVPADTAKTWLSRGYDRLPVIIASFPYSELHACTAYIYEFERETEAHDPATKVPGRLVARAHLERSGLWEELQR